MGQTHSTPQEDPPPYPGPSRNYVEQLAASAQEKTRKLQQELTSETTAIDQQFNTIQSTANKFKAKAPKNPKSIFRFFSCFCCCESENKSEQRHLLNN